MDIRFPVNTKAEDVRQKLNEIASEFGVEVVDDGVQPPLFKDKSSRQIEILTGIYGKYQEQFDFIPEEKEARQNELSKEVAPIAIGGGTYARTMPNIVAFGPQLPWATGKAWSKSDQIRSDQSSYRNDRHHGDIVFNDAAVAGGSVDHNTISAIKTDVINTAVTVIVVTEDITGLSLF